MYDYDNFTSVQCAANVTVSALKIHMSYDAHDAVTEFPEFITECRGDVSVKVTKLLLQLIIKS